MIGPLLLTGGLIAVGLAYYTTNKAPAYARRLLKGNVSTPLVDDRIIIMALENEGFEEIGPISRSGVEFLVYAKHHNWGTIEDKLPESYSYFGEPALTLKEID